MKIFRFLFIFFLFVGSAYAYESPPELTVTLPTGGTTKYVSGNGAGCSNGDTNFDAATNSCGGGSSTVYTTPENADGNVGAGNILDILPGTYNWTSVWNESGSSGNPIVIRAYGGGNSIISVQSGYRFQVFGSYIIFDGGSSKELIIDGQNTGDGTRLVEPVALTTDNTFWRVIIQYGGWNGSKDGGGKYTDWTSVNFELVGNNLKVWNCIIRYAAGAGGYGEWGDGHSIRNNEFFENCGTGLQYNPHGTQMDIYYGTQAAFADNVVISGNMIIGNGDCWSGGTGQTRPGISLLSSDDTLYDVDVYNNIVSENIQYGMNIGTGNTNSTIDVFNNSFLLNTGPGVSTNSGSGTFYLRNNISGNTATGSGGAGNGSADSITGAAASTNWEYTPNFVSVTNTDATFAKIGASNNGYDTNPPVTIGYFGGTRDSSAPDIGAHEYGAGSDTTPPTVTGFVIPSTATSLTVSISTFTATDDTGVTGYCVNESAVAPTAGSCGGSGWAGSAQTDFTFASTGAKTLYAWAKDAAGNISTSLNDSVTITLSTGSATGGGSGSFNGGGSGSATAP